MMRRFIWSIFSASGSVWGKEEARESGIGDAEENIREAHVLGSTPLEEIEPCNEKKEFPLAEARERGVEMLDGDMPRSNAYGSVLGGCGFGI